LECGVLSAQALQFARRVMLALEQSGTLRLQVAQTCLGLFLPVVSASERSRAS